MKELTKGFSDEKHSMILNKQYDFIIDSYLIIPPLI
jgi:hypothetical protein